MPFIKLTSTERRRVTLFLTCLGIAVLSWLFFGLSNRYVYQINTTVRYNRFPANKAFHALQSEQVKLQVEGTGWQLLFSKLRISPHSVSVDLTDLNKRNFITFSDQLQRINSGFASDQKIVSVQPDTLYFDFSNRSVKKVPVKLRYSILFNGQFGVSSGIKLNPEYVTVTGPEKELAGINYWETDSLLPKNVNGPVTARISLKASKKSNIDIYPPVIDVEIPVDELTEKVIEIPLRIINNTRFDDVKLLPAKVKITVLTALSNYSQTNREDFEANVDLARWYTLGYSQLPVNLVRVPGFCKIVRIEPQNADFIIQR